MDMEEDNGTGSNGRRSSRVSQPFESTRMVKSARPSEVPSETATSIHEDAIRDIKPCVDQPSSILNDSEMSEVIAPSTKEHFKEQFNGLNNRLLSYVERVRKHEASLAEAANARKALEEQIRVIESAHEEQVKMLRSEIDERVQKAVIAEEKLNQLQGELEKHEQAIANRDEALEAHRQQQEELERALVVEKQMTAKESRKAAEFKDSFMKTHADLESLKDECTRLKVEIAKLQERAKVASLEKTMHENKAAAAEKELAYSSQDVAKKVAEQRKKLETIGLEKLEELRRKHSQELERCREEFDKKLRGILKTYVTAEEYSELRTEADSNLKRAEQAELMLSERDARILALRNDIEKLEKSYQKKIVDERRRRERINNRLLAQSRDLEEIRTELETYRKLLEGLDIDGNTFCRTPLSGTKRVRTSLELESPSFLFGSRIVSPGTPLRSSAGGTPVTLEARKALLKRALTPRKRTSSDGDEKIPTSSAEKECAMM